MTKKFATRAIPEFSDIRSVGRARIAAGWKATSKNVVRSTTTIYCLFCLFIYCLYDGPAVGVLNVPGVGERITPFELSKLFRGKAYRSLQYVKRHVLATCRGG